MENQTLWTDVVTKQLETIKSLPPDDENYRQLMEMTRKNAELIMADEKFQRELELEYAKLDQEREIAKKNRRSETIRTAVTVGVPIVAGGAATGFLAYLEMTGKMLTGSVVKEGVKKIFMKIFGR